MAQREIVIRGTFASKQAGSLVVNNRAFGRKSIPESALDIDALNPLPLRRGGL